MELIRPEEIIKKLSLAPLADEGGYYRQTWVSDINLDNRGSSSSGDGKVPLGTAVYFLLINSFEGFSALHTLSRPEIYHFYLGDSIQLSLFHKTGEVEKIFMGHDILKGELPQFVVPADVIQGSKIVTGGSYALIGTTMSPGFTIEDFHLKSRKEMLKKYPEYKELVISLTRE